MIISFGLVFAALFSILLILGGFEIYLRFTGYLEAQPANYPCIKGDPVLNHVFEPNCEGKALASALNTDRDANYKVNKLGLRGELPDLTKSRIVVIGDSYTEGFGLEEGETFARQLSSILGKRFNVLNGGTMGFSPAIYPIYFEKYFSEWKPSFVLLNLDFTDFSDDPYYFQIADFDHDGNPKAFPARDVFPSVMAHFVYSNHLAVLRFIHQEVNQLYQISLRSKVQPIMDKFIETKIGSGAWDAIQSAELDGCDKSLKLVFKNVLRLNEIVKASGGKLAIHMYLPGYKVKEIPFRTQNISFVQKYDLLTRKDYSWACTASEKIWPAVQLLAKQENISAFSTIDFLKAHPRNKEFYFEKDAHWNAEGIKAVLGELMRMGLGKEIEGAIKNAPR